MNKVPRDYTYPRTKLLISSEFQKGALILKPNLEHWTKEDFRIYVDKIARSVNNIRMMLYLPYGNACLMPHKKKNKKYVLEEINPKWWKQVNERLEMMVERRIYCRVIINDGHGLSKWHKHWLNLEKNHGWWGQETYHENYGWCKWIHYADNDEIDQVLRKRYEACKNYILWLYEQIIPTFYNKFRPYIGFENNEIDAGGLWHSKMYEILNAQGVKKKNRFTSVRNDLGNPYGYEWIRTKGCIPQHFNVECHGINSIEKYEAMRNYLYSLHEEGSPLAYPWLPCADGYGDDWDKYLSRRELKQLVKKPLRDGCYGFGGNTEGKWDDRDYRNSRVMWRAFLEWMEENR